MALKNVFELARKSLKKLSFCMLFGLAACTAAPSIWNIGADALKSATQYSLGRLDQLWATPSSALIMVDRRVAGAYEQMIGLENSTTLEGDNMLLLIARVPDGLATGRFTLDRLLDRVGGPPSPFRSVDDRSLRSATDGAGTYFWLQYSAGTQTNCVLAFRRMEGGARVLPRDTNAMEALLRNCVIGTVEEALAPIQDPQISLGAIANTTVRNGGNRMLSPLAAPLQ